LLLGPCAVYLAAFSIFPLVTSLVRSFQDYNTRTDTWRWVGLDNYSQLIHSSEFWTVVENTVLLTVVGVTIQVVLGTALALFFNQQLRGASIVRGILILPMLLTPIVVGLMWRALLDPNWGLLNWIFVQIGVGQVGWLSDPSVALWTLVVVDSWQWTPFVFVIVYARLQALPQEVFEAGSVDGANWFQRTVYLTLPLLAPAIVFAAVFRGIDAFRTFDLVYGLTNGGPGISTTTLSFQAFQNGFEFQHYGYASAISYVMVLAAAIGITLLFKVVKVRRLETA
jgi:multiple sugar transport system permease protein